MSNRRYINAVMSVKRIAPSPATIKDGTAVAKATSDTAADASAAARRSCLAALADAAEDGGFGGTTAASFTAAANKALDAADAACVAANNLAALATLYRTEGN